MNTPAQPPAKTQSSGPNQDMFRKYARKLEPLINKPQNRVYTATILSFLVVSLFLWYAIRPTIQTILSLRREISDNQDVSKQMEAKISALVEAQAVYQSIAPQIPLLFQALPEQTDPMPLLFSLRELAGRSAVTLVSVQLPKAELDTASATASASQQENRVLQTSLIVTIDGTYEQIKQFIDEAVLLRRIVTIDTLSIGPLYDSLEEEQVQLRMVAKLQAYYMPGGTL